MNFRLKLFALFFVMLLAAPLAHAQEGGGGGGGGGGGSTGPGGGGYNPVQQRAELYNLTIEKMTSLDGVNWVTADADHPLTIPGGSSTRVYVKVHVVNNSPVTASVVFMQTFDGGQSGMSQPSAVQNLKGPNASFDRKSGEIRLDTIYSNKAADFSYQYVINERNFQPGAKAAEQLLVKNVINRLLFQQSFIHYKNTGETYVSNFTCGNPPLNASITTDRGNPRSTGYRGTPVYVTLHLANEGGKAISGLSVKLNYNSRALTLRQASGATVTNRNDGTIVLEWKLPRLEAGASKDISFEMRTSTASDAPDSATLDLFVFGDQFESPVFTPYTLTDLRQK